MARTTAAQVEAIIDWNAAIDVAPFIEIANNLVTRMCAGSIFGYDNSTLELIERWLAAHYYTIRDKDVRANSEGAGDANQNMGDVRGKGLESTPYGQQVMVFDSQGALAALNKRMTEGVPPKPGAIWLGRGRRRSFGFDPD